QTVERSQTARLVPADRGRDQPSSDVAPRVAAHGVRTQPMTTAFNFGPMQAPLGHFTVGFVGLDNDRAISLGFGTLVEVRKLGGVLTCAPVLAGDADRQIAGVLDRVEFVICCFPVRTGEVQTLRIKRDLTRPVAIGTRPWNEQGPDLAFLRLPDADMTNLERLASVVNGMRQQ